MRRKSTRPRQFSNSWRIIALLLASLVALYERFVLKKETNSPSQHADHRSPSKVKAVNSTDSMAGYVTLKDCRMIPRGGNDGDSYRVRHSEGEEAFRLYFVDTPETNPEEEERLRFQSRYFDSTPDAMLAAGQEAKEYVHGLMQPGKFEVITRWEQVMDGPRYHAFIAVNGRHLHELLVEKGLARIYTMPADLPDGTSKEKHLRYLKSLEAKARQAGRGAWASQ